MTFQSLNPELTAKVLLLANLQRNLIQNHNGIQEKTIDENSVNTTNTKKQQQILHPLLMPSINVSSQKISAMLSALTPSSFTNTSTATRNILPIQQALQTNMNNNTRKMNLSHNNLRSNGSSFGWGNRERKMEENWRLQNRSI
ncbi:hypothetical protein I4U23_030538 [Adineta vaga]|nr:hypothetical protein I4U23_030538 [Adineta vaga]